MHLVRWGFEHDQEMKYARPSFAGPWLGSHALLEPLISNTPSYISNYRPLSGQRLCDGELPAGRLV